MTRLSPAPGAPGTPFGRTLAINLSVKQAYDQLELSLKGSLEASLLELVRLRVANNNGCEY